MQRKINISIPKPCYEDWNKMTPTEQGAFCKVCSKEVIDFSKMKKDDVIDYFSNQNGQVCGRVNSAHLSSSPSNKSLSIRVILRRKILSRINDLWMKMLFSIQNSSRIPLERTHFQSINWTRIIGFASAFFTMLFFNKKAKAQDITSDSLQANISEQKQQFDTITISGTIRDSLTKEGIPYSILYAKKDGVQVTSFETDFDGKYTLKLPKIDFENDSIVLKVFNEEYKTLIIYNQYLNDSIYSIQKRKNIDFSLTSSLFNRSARIHTTFGVISYEKDISYDDLQTKHGGNSRKQKRAIRKEERWNKKQNKKDAKK